LYPGRAKQDGVIRKAHNRLLFLKQLLRSLIDITHHLIFHLAIFCFAQSLVDVQ